MIGLALSGGGSRAIAFHLGCLRALNDLGILDRVGVLSTVSGGSLIGAYLAYSPDKTFSEFDYDICRFLRKGFQQSIIRELLNPENLLPCALNLLATKLDALLSHVRGKASTLTRYPSSTDIFHRILHRDVFPSLIMSSPRRCNIEIVIGVCELRKGCAFRFSNNKSGSWRHGEMVDWEVEVAFAVAASAAYPLLLPALDRTWRFYTKGRHIDHRVLLTDGGVYDNLGLQVLEPERDANVSLHTFPCEYLIVCNAGQGLKAGLGLPSGFLSRMAASFSIVHRRVQDAAMHRLHQMKLSGMIKGFVLPYIGQQDEKLPWKPLNLVPRHEVADYPTNFEAMSDQWIQKLSGRGEQLTRVLVDYYLSGIL